MSIVQIVLVALVADFGLAVLVGQVLRAGAARPVPVRPVPVRREPEHLPG